MTQPIKLSELAERIGGVVDAPTDPVMQGAGTIDTALASEITFADSPAALRKLADSAAGAAIVPLDAPSLTLPVIRVAKVREAFNAVVQYFRPARAAAPIGVSPAAHISPTARVGAEVTIHPGAVIGDDVEIGDGCCIHANVAIGPGCRIGNHSVLFPNVVLYEGTIVGSRVVIHASAVIGAYGFGYESSAAGHRLGAQYGHVEIGDDVEIGACTTVDRGSYGPTRIGAGTKIDNHVMIAHNCRIGRHNLICSQVGIAGSSTTGDFVVMAGQVGVPDHVHIGHRVVLGAKAGVVRDVPDGLTMLGAPATPEREQMLMQASFAKLPEMRKELKALRRLVEQLTSGRADAA